MRLLLVNPNITTEITATMEREASRSASPGTEIVAVTANFGTQYIANRAEAMVAGHAVLDAIATFDAPFDAVIVAAFADPGLAAARELFDVPIVGLAESALLTAWVLGRRISIVCMSARLRTWYRECASEHGLDGRLASVRSLAEPPADIVRAHDTLHEQMLGACLDAVGHDDAEVVIVGGGPLAGLARQIADRVPVPVLDGVPCAVQMAESLVQLSPAPPSRGSFARPEAKPSKGLSAALRARVEHL